MIQRRMAEALDEGDFAIDIAEVITEKDILFYTGRCFESS